MDLLFILDYCLLVIYFVVFLCCIFFSFFYVVFFLNFVFVNKDAFVINDQNWSILCLIPFQLPYLYDKSILYYRKINVFYNDSNRLQKMSHNKLYLT